jgi:hypothetical protein
VIQGWQALGAFLYGAIHMAKERFITGLAVTLLGLYVLATTGALVFLFWRVER